MDERRDSGEYYPGGRSGGGAAVVDDAVTRTSANPVKSSGVWSAVWGALAALPDGFASLYDWCAAQFAGKIDKVKGSVVTGYLPVLKSDGGLQRSYYVPASFAQASHAHNATDICYDGYAGEYAGRYLWEVVDDLADRVAALEQGTEPELASVTLGTVHCDGMGVTAYPHVVGCTSDQYPSPSPDSCMTCLMARADFLLDPNDSMSGDFSYGGQLKPELYGFGYEIGAGFASSHQCRSSDVEFVMDLASSAFCGGVTPLGASDFWSFRVTDYPYSALVQDAEGAWWVCFAQKIGTYGVSNPIPSMPDPRNPQYLAWELQDEWAGSCEDPHEAVVHVFVRAVAGCAGCGVDYYYDGDASVSLCYAPPVGGGCC